MRIRCTKIFHQLSEKRSRLQSLLCEDTVQPMVRMKPKYFPEYLEKQDKRSLRKTVTLKNLTLNQGRTQGGALGLTPPFSLIFYKNFITFARRLIVFAYFLLINLST